MTYCKSPLNYIGGKYKMLPQLLQFFPERTGTIVDLFAGGGDVFANITAERVIANDINYHVIDIFKAFQKMPIDKLLAKIERYIKRWHLTMNDAEAYLAFREHYNHCVKKDPIALFVLVCYSFNYQFRFNSKHEYNNPFGRERSWFNPTLRENLIAFHAKLSNIEFMSRNFKDLNLDFLHEGDFVYADPPYRITTGSYNDGKRGFEGWQEADDIALFESLDRLNERGVSFVLSNVIEHKGRHNDILDEWRVKYNTHFLDYSYNNSSYHAKNKDRQTIEVVITNF